MRPGDNRVLVLADDLTGALEAGALFAGQGIRTSAAIAGDIRSVLANVTVPVVVLDTETRHMSPDEAFRIVRAIAGEACEREFRYIYKKTDSTLRGNISCELAALSAACPDSPLLYVPAYPQLGRTVLNGMLLVDGIPVSQTAFSADALNPVRESHIPTMARSAYLRIPVCSVRPEALQYPLKPALYVVDGVIEEDVRSAARIFAVSPRLRLAAGPAGFVRHFASFIDLPHSEPHAMPRIARGLVINGSLHGISAAQVDHALAQGWVQIDIGARPGRVVPPDWALLRNPRSHFKCGLDFATQLGQHIRAMMAEADFDAMVIFGGDTACGILKTLGIDSMQSLGEVLPGVPVTRIDAAALPSLQRAHNHGFFLITKAGGFGPPDLLTKIRETLR